MKNPSIHPEKKFQAGNTLNHSIILYNDDVHSFDYVIETLVKVCRHEPMQAEQCATIAHCNGRCAIKNGSFGELMPVNSVLHDCGLTTEIIAISLPHS